MSDSRYEYRSAVPATGVAAAAAATTSAQSNLVQSVAALGLSRNHSIVTPTAFSAAAAPATAPTTAKDTTATAVAARFAAALSLKSVTSTEHVASTRQSLLTGGASYSAAAVSSSPPSQVSSMSIGETRREAATSGLACKMRGVCAVYSVLSLCLSSISLYLALAVCACVSLSLTDCAVLTLCECRCCRRQRCFCSPPCRSITSPISYSGMFQLFISQ